MEVTTVKEKKTGRWVGIALVMLAVTVANSVECTQHALKMLPNQTQKVLK